MAASPASAAAARAASLRSGAWTRSGQMSSWAAVPTAAASAQPASRSGSADTGAATITARMNVNSAAVPAAAKYPLMAPEKRMTKPITAIAPVASQVFREQRVPIAMLAAPAQASDV